ncbi:MAG TPA: L-histidine N(alpha)-methyltransferase [bacterium]|nr:L-histidine N(alpha)-methyltransferase [bacterium]
MKQNMSKTIKKENYFPAILKKQAKKIKPQLIIPYEYLFSNPKGVAAFNRLTESKSYWLSSDSALIIKQNKNYLANLLKDYTIVEFGGFDGSSLNDVFKSGQRFRYINIDIGKGILSMMKNNFSKLSNVKYSLIKKSFADISFIKKIKSTRPKALLFLGNTFGNFYPKEGDQWLKKTYQLMDPGDLLIIDFDRRVSSDKHLKCYSVKECALMLILAFEDYGMPVENLHSTFVMDKDGIHGGVTVLKDFTLDHKKFKSGDFIEVMISLKSSPVDMTKRMSRAGFKTIKQLQSDKKHMIQLIAKK